MVHRLSLRSVSGFTLTEIAIVLAIIGIILGSLWVVIANVTAKSRVTNALTELSVISQGMTAMLQGGYGNLVAAGTNITAPMITAGAVSGTYVHGGALGTTIDSPWQTSGSAPASINAQGTGVSLWWVSALGTSPRTYRISFYNVAEDGCMAMLMQMVNCTAGQPGCPTNIRVKLGGHTYNTATQKYDVTTSEAMTSDNAQTMCDTNDYSGGGGANSVEFDFTQ